MLRYLGKRIDRFRLPKQIGADRELGAIIRTTANGLTFEMRILELMEKGLEYEALYGRNGYGAASPHTAARGGTSLHAAARRGTPERESGAA